MVGVIKALWPASTKRSEHSSSQTWWSKLTLAGGSQFFKHMSGSRPAPLALWRPEVVSRLVDLVENTSSNSAWPMPALFSRAQKGVDLAHLGPRQRSVQQRGGVDTDGRPWRRPSRQAAQVAQWRRSSSPRGSRRGRWSAGRGLAGVSLDQPATEVHASPWRSAPHLDVRRRSGRPAPSTAPWPPRCDGHGAPWAGRRRAGRKARPGRAQQHRRSSRAGTLGRTAGGGAMDRACPPGPGTTPRPGARRRPDRRTSPRRRSCPAR